MPPVLRGLLEAALYVTDLRRAIAFYRSVLCLKLLGEFDAERGAAFAVGDSVLLLFRVEDTQRGGDLPPHGAVGAGHVAFAISAGDRLDWKLWLIESGVAIEAERQFGRQPASLYFRDPDGNLLELAVPEIWSGDRP